MGNCFLRILGTAGNLPAEFSYGNVKNIRRKLLVRVTLPVNVSCEYTAGKSAVRIAGNSAAKLILQKKHQEILFIRRKILMNLLVLWQGDGYFF